jgi:hypothetical protein
MMANHRTSSCDVCGEIPPEGYLGSPAAGPGWVHVAIGDEVGFGNGTYDLCSLACFEVVAMRLNGFDADELEPMHRPTVISS